MVFRYFASWLDFVEGTESPAPQLDQREPQLVEKGVYEGARELWGCSKDLYAFVDNLAADRLAQPGSHMSLEIGCGRALPSLPFLFQAASCGKACGDGPQTHIILQDVEFAIDESFLQQSQDSNYLNVTFVQCSWSDMTQWPVHIVIDTLLSSETLYRCEHFEPIWRIISQVLHNKKDALVLVAQKRFYFGCGGGTLPFREFLKSYPHYQMETVHECIDGASSVRDICCIRSTAP